MMEDDDNMISVWYEGNCLPHILINDEGVPFVCLRFDGPVNTI